MRRLGIIAALVAATVLVGAPIAYACGFLVSENGAVRLGRTTTFVTWEDGVERYITNFSFEGIADSFGTIIPLPAEPTDVSRAGDWTLQRLQIEVAREQPLLAFGAVKRLAEGADAEVILSTTIDSLDVVVLKGGAAEVLTWVNANGFDLPEGPATDHMLQFYANRSPYFLAARFDAERAEQDDFVAGDGIPVQITMPTPRPWVPLHILHGAQPDTSIINADVFLLTPDRPNLLHGEGLDVNVSEPADDRLLDDLRSDENMEWIPTDAWFTHLILETDASNLTYDLSVGVGDTAPSFVDAGFTHIEPNSETLRAFGLQQIHWTHGFFGLLAAATIGGVVVASLIGRSKESEVS